MIKYEFEVIGEFIGKQRPRMNTRTGKAYTPTKTKCYEYFIREYFLNKYPEPKILEGRVNLQILAFFKIPKSSRKKDIPQMICNKISPTKKPDIDNIIKSILDALNGFAYSDDTQITKLDIEKLYTDKAYEYVKIIVEEY